MDATLHDIEGRIWKELLAGNTHAAATLALRQHGGDVQRFLSNRLRSASQAEDAYLEFAEKFWLGLPTFRGECSIRIWMLGLARAAATKLSRRAVMRREVACAPGDEPYWQMVERMRTTTALFQRTSAKRRIRALRSQLPNDDQTLLILRINRELSWNELAVVMGVVDAGADAAELARASARMRTRFQAAKTRLRKLAEADGLFAPTEP